jgi:hypothetical protein
MLTFHWRAHATKSFGRGHFYCCVSLVLFSISDQRKPGS